MRRSQGHLYEITNGLRATQSGSVRHKKTHLNWKVCCPSNQIYTKDCICLISKFTNIPIHPCESVARQQQDTFTNERKLEFSNHLNYQIITLLL